MYAMPALPMLWTSLLPESEGKLVPTETEADVIVIGGGIAGTAAALRLKDRGRTPLILEREKRVGGRMTTDRVEGFAIDRGVTLLGNQFVRMRALCQRLNLGQQMASSPFSFGLKDGATCHGLRAGRVDDILRTSVISGKAKVAFLKLSADLALHGPQLTHGRSDMAIGLDDKSAADYFRSLGSGGEELFERLFVPGIRGPVGGDPWQMSRAILMQVVWNILVRGTWSLSRGMDALPEALAVQVPVRTGCRVLSVQKEGNGVRITAENETGEPTTFRARAAIFAIPGHLVPPLCSDLPNWLTDTLARTTYAPMVSAHVAVSRPPDAPYPGLSFATGLEDGVEIELEHRRVPESCPSGHGMVSLYFYPCPTSNYPQMEDDTLRRAAITILERTFPECTGSTRFVHIIRWQNGIARFPPGRLTEMVHLRQRLRTYDQPFEFCGDYWDGIASEAALRTGEQAAERLTVRS